MATMVYVRGADRMITAARLTEDGLYVRFADDRAGLIPLEELALPGLPERVTVPRPHVIRIHLSSGDACELPWDFARHYADEDYRRASEEAGARGRRLFAARLRALRSERGLSQQALARKAGISRVSVARIEAGDQLPRFPTLVALANALDVPTERLLVG